ncbi:MAG: DNA translocase FtsK [Alphaproteobacteria bacterium]
MRISFITSYLASKKIYFAFISLFLISSYLAISILSYNSNDPSFNRASNFEVKNLGGEFGAFIADPLLQLFGLAGLILVLIPFLWGIKLFKDKHIKYFILRSISGLICLITTTILFAVISPPENWPFVGLGGYLGEFLKIKISHIIPAYYFIFLNIFSAILCFFTFMFASAISYKSLINILNILYNTFVYIVKMSKYLILKMFYSKIKPVQQNLIQQYNEFENFDEIDEVIEALAPKSPEPPKFKFPKKEKEKTHTINKKNSTPIKLKSDFALPSLEFLAQVQNKVKRTNISDTALLQSSRMLEQVLKEFGVNGRIIDIHPGPVVTLYELEPAAGVKSSRVIGLADDIARSMSAISARIAVVPGRNAIGIELPNIHREIVYLREILDSKEYSDPNNRLPIILGKDIGGASVVVDLSKMPHLLVAGTTGSGKSVAINTMILSLLYSLTPDECKFIMIDPKMLELSIYDGIPHLLTPVVTEPGKAIVALKWTVKEMENRYRLMSNLSVRNIGGYNKRIAEAIEAGETLERTLQTGFEPNTGKPIYEKIPIEMKPLPYIVVIVDEMADLMLVAGKDIESSIQRLAQMARAAGIHIIMATQRPSVDVITGVIKANFPTRISFQVTSRIDSRTILGEQGAEQLLGMGDMLYMAGGSRITRVHGPFVDDREVEKIVSYLKTQGSPEYIEDVTEDDEENSSDLMADGDSGEDNELYRQAVAIVKRDKKASTSYIQRCLRIGYNRAATIIERMEKEGIVSKANHVGKREVMGEGEY